MIGYTNAGKIDILKCSYSRADTMQRRSVICYLGSFNKITGILALNQDNVTLTDTVWIYSRFYQHLSWWSISQSTLEETRNVDLLLHVVDSSAENMPAAWRESVIKLFKRWYGSYPLLTVYNTKKILSMIRLFSPWIVFLMFSYQAEISSRSSNSCRGRFINRNEK